MPLFSIPTLYITEAGVVKRWQGTQKRKSIYSIQGASSVHQQKSVKYDSENYAKLKRLRDQ